MKPPTDQDKKMITEAFTKGAGRTEGNILLTGTTKEQLLEWQKNGWIELRKDQSLPYWERKVF